MDSHELTDRTSQMLTEYYFRVAGFLFEVSLPAEQDIERLLPSFRPFRVEAGKENDVLFRFAVVTGELDSSHVVRVLEEEVNDLGHTRLLQTEQGFTVQLNYTDGCPMHTLQADARFTEVKASVRWDDPYVALALCSLIRVAYSQAVVFREAISIHASAVVREGKAYLFMGKSGTGKSTHSALWLRCFPGCSLLNDDNPTIRCEKGVVMAYGTPWSGKTSCYKNEGYPVGGMVRLRQARENRFIACTDVSAFVAVLPGCSAIRACADQYNALCDTIVALTEQVTVGELECLPDEEAACLCARSLDREM